MMILATGYSGSSSRAWKKLISCAANQRLKTAKDANKMIKPTVLACWELARSSQFLTKDGNCASSVDELCYML
jgi:hypothetical protein